MVDSLRLEVFGAVTALAVGEDLEPGIAAGGCWRELGDENMEYFTTKIHAMSSHILVMIRIAAEVVEGMEG